jgi:ribose/xylose/arabinose/galactoside ABC-type transport system permease subunit
VQSSIEDIAYARRIGRLRDFYLSVAPELEPHVLVVRGQHAAALLHGQRPCPSGWQLALTTAGMVAVVNSVLIGACAGLLLQTVGVTSLAVTLATGALLAATAQILQSRHHRRTLKAFTLEAVDRAAIFVPIDRQTNTT